MADSRGAKMGRSPMVTGLFRDRDDAERAYSSLTDRGYTRDDINVMMSDETRNRWYPSDRKSKSELGDKALEGAGVGGAIGGATGAIIGAIAAIGTTLALPGLGLLIAGPIAAALAGGGAGALTGGLIGALVGAGIPEEQAKAYDKGIREGGTVIGVTPRNDADADYIANTLRQNGAEHVNKPNESQL